MENTLPSWSESFVRKYRAGIAHCFILHFNIYDYVPGGTGYSALIEYLGKLFDQKDMIILYNISAGIQFLKGTEEEFKKIAGIKDQAQNPLAVIAGIAAQGLPRTAPAALPLLEKVLLEGKTKAALVIDYAERVFPADAGGASSPEYSFNVTTLQRWAHDQKIKDAGNVVILLAQNFVDIHPALRSPDSEIEEIVIEKPDIAEREKYVSHLAKDYREEIGQLPSRQLSHLTAGLSRRQIQDIFKRARESWGTVTPELVKKRKYEVLEKQHKDEELRFVDPIHGWETVGGLHHIKDKILDVLEAMSSGDWRRAPMGILFIGPPGTGKTHVAMVIAKALGFNFVELGMVKSKWVGESERKLAKVLLSVKANVPIVWLIDEIDQILGRRDEVSTDSGVNRALFGEFLKFMSDPTNRGRVLIIGATNRPDLMDPAMKRPGRFDLRIPFLFPPLEERADIFRAMMEKYQYKCAVKDFTPFAGGPFFDIWEEEVEINGADIEIMARLAYDSATKAGREEIQEEDLWAGVKEHIPSYDKELIDYMTLIAIKGCSSRSLLPPNYTEILRKFKEEGRGRESRVLPSFRK